MWSLGLIFIFSLSNSKTPSNLLYEIWALFIFEITGGIQLTGPTNSPIYPLNATKSPIEISPFKTNFEPYNIDIP